MKKKKGHCPSNSEYCGGQAYPLGLNVGEILFVLCEVSSYILE